MKDKSVIRFEVVDLDVKTVTVKVTVVDEQGDEVPIGMFPRQTVTLEKGWSLSLTDFKIQSRNNLTPLAEELLNQFVSLKTEQLRKRVGQTESLLDRIRAMLDEDRHE